MNDIIQRLRTNSRLNALLVSLVSVLFVGVIVLQTKNSQAISNYPVPASFNGQAIVADCSNDVTSVLQSWIDSVPDGSTLTFPASTCYQIDGTIFFGHRNNLTLDGSSSVNLGSSANMSSTSGSFNGATFWAKTDGSTFNTAQLPSGFPAQDANLWPRHRSQFEIYDSTNITLKNMHIHGSANIDPHGEGINKTGVQPPSSQECDTHEDLGPAENNCTYAGQYGVTFNGSSGSISNDMITDTDSDTVGISADNSASQTPIGSTNVTINGNYMAHSNRDGPSIYDGQHVTVNNNYVGDTAGVVFDTEPVPTRWANNYISFTNNTIGPHLQAFLSGAGGSAMNDNIDVENNVILANTGSISIGQGLSTFTSFSGFSPLIRQNLTIANNTTQVPSYDDNRPNTFGAITVVGFTNVKITGNHYVVKTGTNYTKVGIMLYEISNAQITGNVFTHSGANAMQGVKIVDASSTAASANNTICGNTIDGVLDKACNSNSSPPPTGSGSGPVSSPGSGSGSTSTVPVAGTYTPPGSSGATVQVDGQTVPNGSIDTTQLNNGSHVLTVTKNGKTYNQILKVKNGLLNYLSSRHNQAVIVAIAVTVAGLTYGTIILIRHRLELHFWIMRLRGQMGRF